MDAFIKDVLVQIACYLGLVVIVLLALDRFSWGWLRVWFKVKPSRGRFVMVKVRNVLRDYFKAGRIEEGWLIYRKVGKKKSEESRISINESCVYRSMGVYVIDVDEQKDCSVSKDFSAVSGYDAEKNNSLHLRALYKPSIMDDKTKILLILLIVVLLASLASLFISYQNGQKILAAVNALKEVSRAAVTTISPVSGAV